MCAVLASDNGVTGDEVSYAFDTGVSFKATCGVYYEAAKAKLDNIPYADIMYGEENERIAKAVCIPIYGRAARTPYISL